MNVSSINDNINAHNPKNPSWTNIAMISDTNRNKNNIAKMT